MHPVKVDFPWSCTVCRWYFGAPYQRRPGTVKIVIDNEPSWLNMGSIHSIYDEAVESQKFFVSGALALHLPSYPKTNNHVVVKFDTWAAYRAGAMMYRNSADQWTLTTGLHRKRLSWLETM